MRVTCDRRQIFEFEAARTALLCIDFQVDFLSGDGFCAQRGLPVATLRRTLPMAQQVLQASRAAGVHVVHLRESYSPDLSDLNPFRRERDAIIGSIGPLGRFLIRGEQGTATVPEMAPSHSEAVIDKAGFSGFYRTPLDDLLQSRGVTHLILMGITTQVCVSSTLRSAVDYGYFPLVLEDCCQAYDPYGEPPVRVGERRQSVLGVTRAC
jgi:nicotinamidase-related amidase